MNQPELIARLKQHSGFWYLATPYSKYSDGLEAAFVEAAKAAAFLTRHGIGVFSPIAHTHPVAVYGNLDPLDHTIWLPADAPMMAAAVGMVIVKMDGWQESYGIKKEIEAFEAMSKPIEYMGWPDV